MKRRQASVAHTFRMYMIVTIFVVMTSITTWWILREFQELRQETDEMRADDLAYQQDLLKNTVEETVAYIQYQSRLTEERLQQSIRDRVNEAYAIAWNLYNQYHDSLDAEAIQQMIKDALRPARFNHGRGYYFAVNMNGIEELFADRPEFEGQDMSGMRDTKGQYVIRDIIALVKQSGEGFYQYRWTKPNMQGQDFPKMAFVKRFEPYDWIIGTGEYLEDVRADIQQETLQRLITVRFGKDGYLFGSTYHADPLFTNGAITVGTGSVSDLTDPNGVKITQAQRKAAEQPEGGFVRYSWKKLSNPTPSPKIAFVKGVPEWEWIIGAGVYLDEIDAIIALKQTALMRQIRRDIISMLAVFAALLGGSFAAAHSLGKQIANSFHAFTTFFETAATDLTPITDAPLHFTEFERLALSANQMITARQRAELAQQKIEKELAEKHNLLQMLIDSTPDHIYAKDLDHRFLIANQATLRVFGLRSIEEVYGKTDRDFHDTERTLRFEEEERVVMTTGQTLINREDSAFSHATGEQYWFLTTKAPIYDVQGHIIGLVGFNRDITERKRAEEDVRRLNVELEARVQQRTAQLKATNKELESFAYIVSHDLKAPLRNIAQLVNWLVDDYAGAFDKQGKEYADLLLNRVKRMDNLINGVLEYSRIGRVRGSDEPLDLNALLPEVVDTLAPPPQIAITLADALPTIVGDRTRIAQVFQNLIGNAIKFMDKLQGTITIGCRDDGAYWQFSVADNGPGIDAQHYERIFQIFQTLHPRDEVENTGVGLAIVKKIVEFYGGKIWVDSTIEKGSTFVFTLPNTSQ